MNKLSVDKINAVAPYSVVESTRAGYFIFRSDYCVRYTVGFDESDLLRSDTSFLFSIINIDNVISQAIGR